MSKIEQGEEFVMVTEAMKEHDGRPGRAEDKEAIEWCEGKYPEMTAVYGIIAQLVQKKRFK